MSLLTRLKLALAWRREMWRERYTLARARRKRARLGDTVFVGVTGSAGKTMTKDLAVLVLSRKANTKGNRLSLNHLSDIARELISINEGVGFAVFEIATRGPGTIDKRIDLVRPSIAAMTVVGRDHIKSFGTMEAIAEEKGKLIMALPEDGTAVLNIDDPLVRAVGERATMRRIWFGASPEADLRVLEKHSSYPDPLTLILAYQGQTYTCVTGIHGTHLTVPVLAAIGIGLAAGLPLQECMAALKDVPTTPGRMEVVACQGGVTFLRDDYKAPHWSLQMVLDYLGEARAERKVAVIGTLSDYSLSASKLYPKVARRAMEVADLVVFVGPHALRALKARGNDNEHRLVGFTEIEDAHRFLQAELRAGDLVFLKGTNRVDHLVRLLLAREKPVSCWIQDCGWNRFCDACPRLVSPSVPSGNRSTPMAASPEDGEITALNTTMEALPEGLADTAPEAWLVVGLGNQGEKYAGTPHNVGYEALDLLARRSSVDWIPDCDGLMSRVEVFGHQSVLFKPGTAINLTGPVVERVRRRLGISPDRIIAVHDDADLALPDVRLKRKGSDGGHKGLRSLFSALRNDGFMPRIRIGIRAPQDREAATKSLVLQHFAPEDQPAVREGLERAAILVEELIGGDARTAEMATKPRRTG